MYYSINLHPEPTLVQSDTPLVLVRDSGRNSTGIPIPPDEARARQIAREAFRWAAFVSERTRMRLATVQRKALEAACFSVSKRASSLSVPTKLASTGAHQRQLWAMLRKRVPAWAELELNVREDELAVLYEGGRIGAIQRKHCGWLRPLASTGARLYLARVTGSERSGYTLGVNLIVGHAGHALDRLLSLLGEAGYGGDGASEDGAAGAGAAGHLRLVSSALSVAKPQPYTRAEPDPDDIVLTRSVDGAARATQRGRPVPHAVRHSPTGFEWGYHGSGPADLARSVLLAFCDEATAERIYQAFKAEVVAAIPRAGGVIRAADVRSWIVSKGAGSC